MKKLDKLILKSFLGPLALTFAIAIFVLLMQFLWKYIDDMVGKGLEFSVIAELIFWASSTFVPMALPIAVLFASIMTMGNFGEKYELVAMKAGGISVRRVMMPMAIVAVLLTGVAFYFANNVMPVAMLHYKQILYDVTRKKPAINIRPSEYYSDIDNYVIRANKKLPDGTLKDIIVYDHSNGTTQTNVVVADNGFLQSSPDEHYMIFTLNDGYTYMEDASGDNWAARPFTSIQFDTQVITFDITSFQFDTSSRDFFSNSYQMWNVTQLDSAISSLESKRGDRFQECRTSMSNKMHCYTIADTAQVSPAEFRPKPLRERIAALDKNTRQEVYRQARLVANQNHNDITTYQQIVSSEDEYINRHYIEWQRKYTLSVACLLLFLVGAPFGSIVRKGGLGLPLVASVVFFVLYYVIGMIAEKAVRTGAIGPIGMWVSTFVLLPIGIVLTLIATTDSALFDQSAWSKKLHGWSRIFRKKK